MSESNTNSKTGRGSATSGLVDTNQTATCTYNKEPYTNHIYPQSIKIWIVHHLQQNCISNLFLLQFLTYPYNCKTIIKDLENHFLPLYQPRHLTKRGCVGPSEQMLPHKTTSTPDRQRTTWPGSCKRKYICKVSLLVLFDIS